MLEIHIAFKKAPESQDGGLAHFLVGHAERESCSSSMLFIELQVSFLCVAMHHIRSFIFHIGYEQRRKTMEPRFQREAACAIRR